MTATLISFLVFFLLFKGALIPIIQLFDRTTPDSDKYCSKGYSVFYLVYTIVGVLMIIFWN